MSCYIVSFQAKELETRQALRKMLQTYPGHCAIHNTCWAIVTDRKATEIRDHLKDVLLMGDRLFVVRSGTEGAWRNAAGGTAANEWLKKYL